MRRKDREMDEAFAWQVLENAPYATLSLVDGDMPYAIPLSPVVIGKSIYFHCAPEGRKIDALSTSTIVNLSCVSTAIPVAWDFSLEYSSALFEGTITIIEDEQEKIHALRELCLRYAQSNMSEVDNAINRSIKRTTILRMNVTTATGKRKTYNANQHETTEESL